MFKLTVHENFTDFSGANAALANPPDTLEIIEVLKTTAITANGVYSYQYEGRFDYVRTHITLTSGTISDVTEIVTVED